MNLLKRLLPIASTVLLAAPSASQQPATDGLRSAFETASISPTTSQTSGRGAIRLQPSGGLVATNVTLRQLVEFAYQRHPFDQRELAGGPSWIDSDRFDLVAKMAGEHVVDPDGGLRRTWSRLRTLLANRFKLMAHEENRDRSVYVLIMATAEGTLGAKLRKSDVDCSAAMKGHRPALRPGQGPPCGFKTPPGRLFANTFTMPAVASLISRHVDRPVIDRTGLEGTFDMELESVEIKAAPDYQPGPSDLALPPPAGPSLFVAVREQLGLKLDPRTAAIPVVVITRAERPIPQ